MAAAYQDEVENYSEFYVDALGKELPNPQPHTKTLGECAVLAFGGVASCEPRAPCSSTP
jgi:hypothetical protein